MVSPPEWGARMSMNGGAEPSDGAPPRALLPRILLVDDDAHQRKLSALRLREEGFQVETAASGDQAFELALGAPPDAIVSDVIMQGLGGFGLCQRVRDEPTLAAVPVVLLSAQYSEASDHDLARRLGACSLITRTPGFDDELQALRHSLRTGPPPPHPGAMAVAVADHLRSTTNELSGVALQARRAEQRYRALFDAASDIVSVLTPEGIVLEINPRAEQILGLPRDQIVGRCIPELTTERAVAGSHRPSDPDSPRHWAVPFQRGDGSTIQLDVSANTVEIDGQAMIFSIARDVTEIVAANRALATAEDQSRSIIERIPDVVWTTDVKQQITFITENVADLLGVTRDQIYAGQSEVWTSHIHPEDLPAVLEAARVSFETGRPLDVEYRWARGHKNWIWLRSRASVCDRDGLYRLEGVISDVTEQRRMEENLRQAQKMEALGQLTGGISHDFNNILASILASSHFLLDDLSAADPRRADAEDIRLSAQRAAALTRQLLAFSRRQVLAPAALDLNVTVGGLERMLRRLIGEDIDLKLIKDPDLGTVMADAGQIEQVVMNLVGNARDAMPGGGKLSIETFNVDLDGSPQGIDLPAIPGRYVMLAVSDDGCGMSAETQLHAFEPFFTTKDWGKGTGLGLSTCYGIVKQSGGYLCIYSEPGAGTVFKIYLPRVDARPDAPPLSKPAIDLRGHEAVLLVEDDERVRSAMRRILGGYGYRVLVARDGGEAIALAKENGEALDLVLSDVIIPGLSGPDTVREVQKHAPHVKALFMSGYTDHAILRDGLLQAGTNFIQKPFAPETLARKLREILEPDGRAISTSGS
jgi:two-component system cell cycle sensor histidine kinase/response regulator CckA